ncbi:MAG TPA: AI-2E family transporter [Xanthomonadales bacterium]|nr:AI-2E family transporter [Xanthomonadales bacterium]
MELLKNWFKRSFSDPQVVVLGVVLIVGFAVIIGLGRWLAPLFAALVVAYLLEALVVALQRTGLSRLPAVVIVFLGFMALLVFLLLGVIPSVLRQLTQLVQQLPDYLAKGQDLLEHLPEKYPQLVSEEQVQALMSSLGQDVASAGQQLLAWSLSSVVMLFALIIFLVLVPVLVFFFMKDKDLMIQWLVNFLPKERSLVTGVWVEAEMQVANYVRGKVMEIFIVGSASYVTFILLDLQYSALLAFLVGVSVLIPYIGAAVATLPIAVVAYFQFGWSLEFVQVLIAYGVIQALDGNVLVPVLFSEVVNLHPVGIVLAILVFGGLWGFWGVFFAIPLATLVQAVLKAWPRAGLEVQPESESVGGEVSQP